MFVPIAAMLALWEGSPRARGMSVAATHAPGRIRPLVVLWRFSRPHTIIGTTLSMVGLYLIAASESGARPR